LSFHAWLEAYLAFFKTEIGGVFMTPLELRATLQDGGTAEQPLAEQTLARAASAE
jgi:hypothetical protein